MTDGRPPLVILRPEPGNAATADRAAAAGWPVVRAPHDRLRQMAVDWAHAATFDGLILTSAAAVAAADGALRRYRHLPLACVGAVTAAAARGAGLEPVLTGAGGLDDLLAAWPLAARTDAHLLWVAGAEHRPLPPGLAARVTIVAAYAMDAQALDPAGWPDGAIILLHSARAAMRLAAIVPPERRPAFGCVAISAAVADAAGAGWAERRAASAPEDGAMLACAENLWQKRRP